MKKTMLLFLVFMLTLFSACNSNEHADTASSNKYPTINLTTEESFEKSTEFTQLPNNMQTDYDRIQTSSDKNGDEEITEIRNNVCPFNITELVEVKALLRGSDGDVFDELRTVTAPNELQKLTSVLMQEKWTYFSSADNWVKYNPSIPNERIVILQTRDRIGYVIHLYSRENSNGCFLSVAKYDSDLEYSEFENLSDNDKDFKRYSVSKDIYLVLLELYN